MNLRIEFDYLAALTLYITKIQMFRVANGALLFKKFYFYFGIIVYTKFGDQRIRGLESIVFSKLLLTCL